MARFILRILGNAVAVWLAFWLVPGFLVTGGIPQYLLAGLVLALLNMILRPILKLISFPLIILSLGLFTLVINALMLWVLDYFLTSITIADLTALVWATIVVSIVNLIVSIISKVA